MIKKLIWSVKSHISAALLIAGYAMAPDAYARMWLGRGFSFSKAGLTKEIDAQKRIQDMTVSFNPHDMTIPERDAAFNGNWNDEGWT